MAALVTLNDGLKIPFEEHTFGFTYGAITVTRTCSDPKKGWVVIQIKTPKQNLDIYATKTGFLSVTSRKHNSKKKVHYAAK